MGIITKNSTFCPKLLYLFYEGEGILADYVSGILTVQKSGRYSAYFGLNDYPEIKSSEFKFFVKPPYVPIHFTKFNDEITLKPNSVNVTEVTIECSE
jgi:hypothetical protein